jgi:hypothetical protein
MAATANPVSRPCGEAGKVIREDPGMAAHQFWAKGQEGAHPGWLSAVAHERWEGNDDNGVDRWSR